MESLVIKIKGVFNHFFCGGCGGIPLPEDMEKVPAKEIPIFSSFEEAYEAGWVFTRDERFRLPGKPFVAICPKCAKKFRFED